MIDGDKKPELHGIYPSSVWDFLSAGKVSWKSRTSQSCGTENRKEQMPGCQVKRSDACQEKDKPSLA